MVVNLIGPPASGKTALARRLVAGNPALTHLSIDQMRREAGGDEDRAWENLARWAKRGRAPIIETSGVSTRLKALVDDLKAAGKQVITVMVTGQPDVLLSRLSRRPKDAIPFPYRGLSTENLVKQYGTLSSKAPAPDVTLDTTEMTEADAVAELRRRIDDAG